MIKAFNTCFTSDQLGIGWHVGMLVVICWVACMTWLWPLDKEITDEEGSEYFVGDTLRKLKSSNANLPGLMLKTMSGSGSAEVTNSQKNCLQT
jgi:hypothetical protein